MIFKELSKQLQRARYMAERGKAGTRKWCIFAVEDDEVYLKFIKYILQLNPDHKVHTFTTGEACLNNLHLQPDIIILDLSLPDAEGQDVFDKIKESNILTNVVILSAQQDIAKAVHLLKEGAFDYISKDKETRDRLLHTIQHIKNQQSLRDEIRQLETKLDDDKRPFGDMINGSSHAIEKAIDLAKKAAQSDITVSITGETGTGKEVIAKSIHYNSGRRKGPFKAINMAAIPSELLESELFGYKEGAFTGATSDRKGMFELADTGTLFLDEIAEMPLSTQTKILRALQEREVTPVGAEKSIPINCRIISATHKDLRKEVQNGNFRQDLFFRLMGLPIPLPPLRERGKDIIVLAEFFLADLAKENPEDRKFLSPDAKTKLLQYYFPGNVRELKAIIELASVLCDTTIIDAKHLKLNPIDIGSSDFFETGLTMEQYKQKIIKHYLNMYSNNVSQAATALGIGKSTIYNLLSSMEKESTVMEKA